MAREKSQQAINPHPPERLPVVFKEQERKTYVALGIHEKGKVPAESMAFARYAMFGAVYWHHTSRAAKAMLHRAVWEALLHQGKKPRAFHNDFFRFVMDLGTPSQLQFELFQESKKSLPSLSQLLPSDHRVLEWFAEHTSPPGRELLIMLSNRRLFKRLLVVSPRKNPRLWDVVTTFRARVGWEVIVDLQKEIQRRIVDLVRGLDDSARKTTSALETTATDRVIALQEGGAVLILGDIPIARPGSDIPLEYLPEADRRDTLQEWKTPSGLEDSVIWNQLHESFLVLQRYFFRGHRVV